MDDEVNEKDFQDDAEDSENGKKGAISSDLIRGHINTIILRTLYDRDKYGYEIIEEIESKSHGQYSIKQPTLYSALKRLESQGYINAYWKNDEVSQGGRRKYYTLTDSGREITEKNQAEWEYSRTVIDSLISDRNFDFSQPAPATVDFKILKNSTSRVPTKKDSDDEDDAEREVRYDDAPTETLSFPVKNQPSPERLPVQEEAPVVIQQEQAQVAEAQSVNEPVSEPVPEMDEETRRRLHENYMKLISEPESEKREVDETPYADSFDTEKLIYNNKPEPERDYRNLINNLFSRTIKGQQTQPDSAPAPTAAPYRNEANVRMDDLAVKAEADGLKVSKSDYVVSGTRRRRYNRGGTLFKCSLIVAVIMMLEFALCLIFKNDLDVGLAYPFAIFALACAQLLIFGVLCFTDAGKSTRRPTTLSYLSACVIVSVIIIFIICLISVLIGTTFTAPNEIIANIVIPSIVALNIPIFAVFFYIFSK